MSELLKRYAAQRKAELPDDLEMHPATRNLLQGEVTRTLAATDGTEKKKSLFVMLWPRLAIAGAFTAMLIVTVIALNKPRREMQVAQNSPQVVAPAPVESRVAKKAEPIPETLADESASPKRQIAASPAPASAQTALARDGTSQLKTLTTEARSEPHLSKPIQQPVPGERKSGVLAGKSFPEKQEAAETFAKTESASGAVAATEPQPPSASAKNYFGDAGSQNRWQFVKQDSRAKYRRNFQSPAQPKILQSFELVRTGDKIQVIENDGSIYDGEILAAATDKSGEEKPETSRDQKSEFAFRVSGTNQQLNRMVTFTGNFAIADAESREDVSRPPNDSARLGLAKQKASAPPGIVQGEVSIAGTNEFQIRAIEAGK